MTVTKHWQIVRIKAADYARQAKDASDFERAKLFRLALEEGELSAAADIAELQQEIHRLQIELRASELRLANYKAHHRAGRGAE